MEIWRDDEGKFEGVFILLVVGPFIAAFAMFGFSLAVMAARFLFEVVLNAGRLP